MAWQYRKKSSLQRIFKTGRLCHRSLLQIQYHLTKLKGRIWQKENSCVKKNLGDELAQMHYMSFIQEPWSNHTAQLKKKAMSHFIPLDTYKLTWSSGSYTYLCTSWVYLYTEPSLKSLIMGGTFQKNTHEEMVWKWQWRSNRGGKQVEIRVGGINWSQRNEVDQERTLKSTNRGRKQRRERQKSSLSSL